jgi:hypothetical protein
MNTITWPKAIQEFKKKRMTVNDYPKIHLGICIEHGAYFFGGGGG